MTQKEEDVSLLSPVRTMKCRKILKGHRGRVLNFDWSPDKSHVLTAGQVGITVGKRWLVSSSFGSHSHTHSHTHNTHLTHTPLTHTSCTLTTHIPHTHTHTYLTHYNTHLTPHLSHTLTHTQHTPHTHTLHTHTHHTLTHLTHTPLAHSHSHTQDGNAVVWDGFLSQKEIIIQTSSSWVLACSYAPSTTLVACGYIVCGV